MGGTTGASTGKATLELHHVAAQDGLLVKVQPPRAPTQDIHHVPCDIVLVIDISGSMGSAAPVPGEDTSEDTGLSVLDLTKHAAFTIIETMDERDRLGIVTFGTKSRIVQSLEPMTDENKDKSRSRIKALRPIDSTNLWHGLLDGIKLFSNEQDSPRVPAIMILTDGQPNHMCPSMGYIPKLQSMPPLPASIHTFGFGYSLRSGLLKSLAEYGGGNFAFIPDAGMIGTVFVHALANLQSTFATNAHLTLTYASPVEIKETTGKEVGQQAPLTTSQGHKQLTISLGNIQYGQSRDIWLQLKNTPQIESFYTEKGYIDAGQPDSLIIDTTLNFKSMETEEFVETRTSLRQSMLDTPNISKAELAYHESRAQICKFLSTLFPLGSDDEHRAISPGHGKESTKRDLAKLIADVPAQYFDDVRNKSLMEDLNGPEPKGQISLAIESNEFFSKWGKHFLPSYLNAHTRQICNSFKDSGPLQYGVDSPLFVACRTRLDNAFDSLPAPEPSRRRRSGSSNTYSAPISMARYRNVSGVCFAGSTPVELASGKMVEIKRLKRGLKVKTPMGPRKVAIVLKTPVTNETLCRVGPLLVTPWHPISADGKEWNFPASTAERTVRYTGAVYSVLLEQDRNANAHAIKVAGSWGVTLGHGIVRGDDVRGHEFFGDYARVGKSLMQLPRARRNGVVVGQGVERCEETGLVKGFKMAPAAC